MFHLITYSAVVILIQDSRYVRNKFFADISASCKPSYDLSPIQARIIRLGHQCGNRVSYSNFVTVTVTTVTCRAAPTVRPMAHSGVDTVFPV